MILVSTGMHYRGFDRLVKGVDELIRDGKIKERVFIQTGYATFEPEHCEFRKVVPFEEMEALMRECRVLITHGGAGLIADGLEEGKPVIAVPRRFKHNEHSNDHQLELTGALEKEGRIVVVHDVAELPAAIEKAGTMTVQPAKTGEQMMGILQEFLDSLGDK